jgi:hypothetical protein
MTNMIVGVTVAVKVHQKVSPATVNSAGLKVNTGSLIE